MSTIVGILTFISMINTTESLKAMHHFQHLSISFYEMLSRVCGQWVDVCVPASKFYTRPDPEVIRIFMLNSTVHEIYLAHKLLAFYHLLAR